MHRITIYLLYILFFSCQSVTNIKDVDVSHYKIIERDSLDIDWFHKDIIQDSIPGTSLLRLYDNILKNRKGKEVIVAILDMSVDIEHKHLRDQIWLNTNEISNNGIDDDSNGYIDDMHGWNFLGNQYGDNLSYEQLEYTRIIKYINNKKTLSTVDSILFLRAKKAYDIKKAYEEDRLNNINLIINNRAVANNFFEKIFVDKKYTLNDLDSIRKVYPKDSLLQVHARRMSNFMKYGYTNKRNESDKVHQINIIEKLLNQDFPERKIIADTIEESLDIKYGNNQVNFNSSFLNHGTLVSGFFNTKFLNRDSVNIFENIKIMPLRISAYGDEYDKDIALAIRYAIDNGASVINMSFGKHFSLNKKWVDDAIKYAESKGVLIVKSAGNDRLNTDIIENVKYPNDYSNEIEFSSNFITVAGSSYRLDEKFLYYETNYGKETVDVFAPGYELTTLLPNNEVVKNQLGTSFSAAIVSGISALLFSYYPELNATEIKKIIVKSSLTFEHMVNLPKKRGEEEIRQLPFNELSKSGGIVNAYNAMLMAEEFVKKKKK